MQNNNNTYLKRGEGKIKGDIKKASFFLFYIKNAKETLLSNTVYKAFLKELLETYSREIVTTGLELRINKVGKFRIKSSKLKFFDKNGVKYKSLRPDWKSSWELWHKKYPELTKDQIAALTNKTVIYHENDHSDQEFYEHYWDKTTINLKFKSFYTFKASRQYSRLIAKIVKDPNRKVFYYG